MANLSHIVNSLTFGSQYSAGQARDILATVPDHLVSEANIHPLDTTAFLNRQLHQAYHHYIKVCTAIQRSVSVDIHSPDHAHDFMDVLRWCLPM